jgi:hypothetical protein
MGRGWREIRRDERKTKNEEGGAEKRRETN